MDKITKVLITGSSGYIGKNLVQNLKLKSNYQLLLIDIVQSEINHKTSEGIRTEIVNLLDNKKLSEIVNSFKPEYIFHLGAIINRGRDYSNFKEILDTNVLGTLNLLNCLKDIEYKDFIYVSTGEVYAGKSHPPSKESDLILPISPYSVSKASAEMLISNFSQIQQKPYKIIRLFNIYGKNMPKSFFIRQLYDAKLDNVVFNMTLGEQKRDYIFIDDVIDAFQAIISSTKKYNGVFNLCTGSSISMREIVEILNNQFKLNIQANLGGIPYRINEVFELTGDNSKMHSTFGFIPKYNIIEGLKTIFINDSIIKI